MKRSPLKRKTPLRSRPQRRARASEPLADECEARLLVCTGRAEHRHHIVRRSQGGGDHAANTLDVCSACHRYIHDHPGFSLAHGLIRRPGDLEAS